MLPVNAVGIVMKEKNCSEAEAREIVKDQFERYQSEHITQVELLRVEIGVIQSSFQKIISSMQSTVSGTAYWSTISHQYPTKAQLNQPECILIDGKLAYKDDDELVLKNDVDKKGSKETLKSFLRKSNIPERRGMLLILTSEAMR